MREGEERGKIPSSLQGPDPTLVLLGVGTQVQHHKAITGTHTPKVSDMFVGRLNNGMHGVQKLMSAIIQDRFPAHTGKQGPCWEPLQSGRV